MSAANVSALRPNVSPASTAQIDALVEALDRDGCVALPQLLTPESVAEMQATFESRLRYFAWNDVTGYTRTEGLRLVVPDVLTLAQGFIDIGVHPIVTGVMERYVGKSYGLAEAKGWQTQRTMKDFHGWHGDAWYDQETIKDRIPREVKLAFYLTDVKSGAFQYIKGSHRKAVPRLLRAADSQNLPMSDMQQFMGMAGTAMLFDTSGIHRQGVPVLEPRRAVFYNYHDLDVPLQKEDVDYYRYHPLALNAAFLGGLTAEQQRVLGFGNKQRLQQTFVRKPSAPVLHAAIASANIANLHVKAVTGRVIGKLRRMMTPKT